MSSSFNRFLLLVITLFVYSASIAQPPSSRDTTRKAIGPSTGALNQGPKPYKDVITDKAKTDDGLFKVHKVDDKWYFEIPDSLLGRDIMVVNRITRSSVNAPKTFGGYAGDEINESVIRFEKGPNNKIYLKSISYTTISKDSTQPMYQAVMNSNIQPISASFDIKALSKDSTATVIDVSDYLNSDNDIVAFAAGASSASTSILFGKSVFQAGSFQSDKSYVSGVRSFPVNIEVTSVKTYTKTAAPGFGGSGTAPGSQSNITLEINNSFVLLPAKPMNQRLYDSRIGYFSRAYSDYDLNPQRVETTNMILRWRLEPKDEDVQKYINGELVEPRKPIIFYIDPATPKKWVPYLIQGINDWQGAFEKAGFKNAIMGKEAPVNDSNWSLEDSRFSAIVYKPSPVENAYGPSVTDPRSGEILESHVGWFHNVMSLIHDWYFVQTAAIDPRARKMTYDDELMGELIRFVSSHEVGHTLGLAHNFGSSSTVPVEKLRDKAWVEANGHTPSIMDYARFNYVAQPEDSISEKGIFPRIGDYDKWAIEWGYRLFPQYKNAEEEKDHLNKWVIEKMKNKRLWYGVQGNPDDPRSQNEDLGDDAMKASWYGIKNLQRIVPNLVAWTKEPDEDYSNLREMYGEVTNQFNRYMGHVTKNVGGIMETPKTVEEQGPVYEIVTKEKQKEAVDFLNKQLFTTPAWLINQDILNRTGGRSGLNIIGNLQDNILSSLLGSRTLNKLVDAESAQGSSAYKITELLNDLKKGIWSELAAHKPIDVYRRNLQKSYVNILDDLVNPSAAAAPSFSIPGITIISYSSGDKSDVRSVVRAHLAALRTEVNAAAAAIADPMTKYHLQDISKRIDKALNPKD
jgi:Met-zincin/Domain of unknown function (DUF5117)/Domain of unknown function (DUF5118)